MAYQSREYFCNGKSVLLDKYQDVEDAKNDQEIEALNSIGSGYYQSNTGDNFNQTGNQFMDSTRFNNQGQRPLGATNNANPNSDFNSFGSPYSTKYPIQNFDNINNKSNGFQTQQQYYKTDGMNSVIQNQGYNNVGMSTNYQQFYPNNPNSNSQTQNQMTQQKWKKLEELVEKLYDYYYTTKGFFQNDPKMLFDFYYEYKKRFMKGIRITERILELMYYKEEDVQNCISYFLNNIKNRFKNTSYNNFSSTMGNTKVKRSVSMTRTGETNINNKYSKKFTKETLRRLYPKQIEVEQRERDKLNCDDFYGFFQKLLSSYYKEKGRLTNNKDELINYWKDIPNKRRKGLEWENGEKDLIEETELFFNDENIIQRISDIFYKHTKFRTYHPRPLHDFWEYNLTEEDRYYNGLNKHSKDDLYTLLNKYYEQLIEENKKKMENLEKEKREQELKEQNERKREILETKEEREKNIDRLSVPKNRYETGLAMLALQKDFKYDNIIKKMIKNEFKDNKIFKFPEEYAVRDEDEQNLLFKHQSKGVKKNENEERIKEQIEEAYDDYNVKRDANIGKRKKLAEEKRKLFNFIKEKVKEYYKRMSNRLKKDKNSIESINLFLNNMYKEMSRKHRNATRLYFKAPRCQVLKKAYKYKKNHNFYPRKLKYYFFRLLRRIGRDPTGKIVFAKNDLLPFWGPSLSNNCKIHGNNCPMYCCLNTHNDMIKELRNNNFNSNFNLKNKKKNLIEKETLNLWKRPDVRKAKEKIFMCFEDAEHCTFEKKKKKKDKNESLTKEELIKSRLNNMEWVKDMGKHFTKVRNTIYKEGILKRAKILFADGRYKRTIELLKKAFDLKAIRLYKKYGEYRPKPKENENNQEIKPRFAFDKKDNEDEPVEIFTNEKNKLINYIYFMLKTIDEYKKRQKKQTKKLEEEIEMIEYNKKFTTNKNVNTKEVNCDEKYSDKNPQYTFIKEKYFNYKTKMCPLKDKCPNLIPNKEKTCPYAHQISELKFDQQIKENIKLRKNLLKKIEKEPNIEYEWVPTGPLVSCIGCGMFNNVDIKHIVEVNRATGISAGKGICGFCKYNKRNLKTTELNNKATKKKNEKILKKIGYKGFQYD